MTDSKITPLGEDNGWLVMTDRNSKEEARKSERWIASTVYVEVGP